MDPIHGHDYYNMSADVEYLLKGRRERKKQQEGPLS
jgi:hypothetical protein